jgi:hypothetical protein
MFHVIASSGDASARIALKTGSPFIFFGFGSSGHSRRDLGMTRWRPYQHRSPSMMR